MLLKKCLLLSWLILGALGLFAQLTIKTEKTTATFHSGDTAWLLLTADQTATGTLTFNYDRFTTPLQTEVLSLSAGKTLRYPFVYSSPGVIRVKLTQASRTAGTSLVFDPFQIKPLVTEPTDFDKFWEQQKKELSNLPIDPELTEISQTAYATTYRINLATVANRRVYGYISVPKGTGPYPAILSLPAFGDAPNIVQPEPIIAERAGAISLTISIHNAEPDAIDPNAYSPDRIDDPNGYYLRWAVQAGLRAIEYLFTRPDFDRQHLGVAGVSQGGGLAIMLAGLDQRVSLVAISNPAYCQHEGLANNRASGFPYLLNNSRNQVGTASHEAATLDASRYYDAIFFAKRYKGPVLMIASYQDDVCPAATSLAAFNQMSGTKVLVHARDLGHAHPSAYWDGRFDFFRQHFPPTRTPPWPWPETTTGYLAFAGEDQSLNASETAQLQGQVSLNQQTIDRWPVRWEKVSGPGDVQFDKVDACRSRASFSAAGRYLVQFSAQDRSPLRNEGLFFSAIDVLTVEVDGNGGADLQPPRVLLDTDKPSVSDPFRVEVNFSEPILGFSQSDLRIENGSLSNLVGSGTNYQLSVQPLFPGAVRIHLPAAQVRDTSGNPNLASDTLIVYHSDPDQELLTLSGSVRGNTVYLNWLTNTDFKNQQFIIERSADSATFRAIGTIHSNNQPAGPVLYTFEDIQPLSGPSYYRIIQREKTGVERSSNTIRLAVDEAAKQLSLYPNPTDHKIYIDLRSFAEKKARIQVFNIQGRSVDEINYAALPAESIELDVSDWENGFYFLDFTIKGTPRFGKSFAVHRNGN